MGVDIVSIEQRYYLGHYREGTVFNSYEDYLVDGRNVSVRTVKRFYKGRNEKTGANEFGFKSASGAFELNEQDAAELARIIAAIKTDPDAKCTADHYKKNSFDRRRFDYFCVSINDVVYELNKSDANLAGGLTRILRIDEMLANCGVGETKKTAPVKAASDEDTKLLEQPERHEPEKILAKNEETETGDATKEIVIEMKEPEGPTEESTKTPQKAKAFRRELLKGTNNANWNAVAGKY